MIKLTGLAGALAISMISGGCASQASGSAVRAAPALPAPPTAAVSTTRWVVEHPDGPFFVDRGGELRPVLIAEDGLLESFPPQVVVTPAGGGETGRAATSELLAPMEISPRDWALVVRRGADWVRIDRFEFANDRFVDLTSGEAFRLPPATELRFVRRHLTTTYGGN